MIELAIALAAVLCGVAVGWGLCLTSRRRLIAQQVGWAGELADDLEAMTCNERREGCDAITCDCDKLEMAASLIRTIKEAPYPL